MQAQGIKWGPCKMSKVKKKLVHHLRHRVLPLVLNASSGTSKNEKQRIQELLNNNGKQARNWGRVWGGIPPSQFKLHFMIEMHERSWGLWHEFCIPSSLKAQSQWSTMVVVIIAVSMVHNCDGDYCSLASVYFLGSPKELLWTATDVCSPQQYWGKLGLKRLPGCHLIERGQKRRVILFVSKCVCYCVNTMNTWALWVLLRLVIGRRITDNKKGSMHFAQKCITHVTRLQELEFFCMLQRTQ